MALVKFSLEIDWTFAIHSKPNQTKLNIFNDKNYLLPQMPNIVKTKTNQFVKRRPKNVSNLRALKDLATSQIIRVEGYAEENGSIRNSKYQHSHEVSEYCKLMITNSKHMSDCMFFVQSKPLTPKNRNEHFVVFSGCLRFSAGMASHAMVKGCLQQNRKCIVSTIAAATLYLDQEHTNTFGTIPHVMMPSKTIIQLL